MKFPQLRIIDRFLICSLPIILSVALISCAGGGTAGTGGFNVNGSLRSVSGQPIPNATVTILETGSVGTTDAAGNFVLLDDQSAPTRITFEVQVEAQSAQTTLSDIPGGANALSVELEFDDSNHASSPTVEVTGSSFRHEDRVGEGSNGGDEHGGSGSQGSDDDGGDDRGGSISSGGSGGGSGSGDDNSGSGSGSSGGSGGSGSSNGSGGSGSSGGDSGGDDSEGSGNSGNSGGGSSGSSGSGGGGSGHGN